MNNFNFKFKKKNRNYKKSQLRIPSIINKLNIEKTATIAGSFFLVFVITFSLYSVIQKNQQKQLQSTANEFLIKSISSIAINWDYSETKSFYSDKLIQKIENNNLHIFRSFSRLGKFVSNEEPILLNNNPAPASGGLTVKVSYKVLTTFENGQAILLFNLIDQKEVPVINFINIDAVYYVNSAINSAFDYEHVDSDTTNIKDADTGIKQAL